MRIAPGKLSLSFVAELTDGLASLSLSQFGEDLFVERFFGGRTEGFYVDAGAFHPRRYSNTYVLRTFLGWTGVNVDASEEAIRRFERVCPRDVNVHAALDEEEREVEFVLYGQGAFSTIDDGRKAANLRAKAGPGPGETRRMRTRRLGDVLAEAVPEGRAVDFLSVDVEGRDEAVLRSLDWDRHRPELVCVEDHAFVQGVNAGEPSAILLFMRSQGYRWLSHHRLSSFYARRGA